MLAHPAFFILLDQRVFQLLSILTGFQLCFPHLTFAQDMKMHLTLKRSLTTGLGIVVCAWSAALLSLVFHGRQGKLLAPILLLVVVAMVAIRCGVVAGVVGSITAALIFAVYLYQPLGTPLISNNDARANLSWLVLGGLAFSYLLGQSSGGRERPN